MAYIIENVNLWRESGTEITSLLINEQHIQSIRSSFNKFSHMRMNAKSFIMTPSHIIFAPHIPFDRSFHDLKQYYVEELIKNGCTTFLTYVPVEREYLLEKRMKEIKTRLLNSPIDYIIGIKIPLKLLTPGLIRKCRRERVPVIFVEIISLDELEDVPWGWIREAMFPYNSPLAPIFINKKEQKHRETKEKWIKMMMKEKIPFIPGEIAVKKPVTGGNLRKMGILPLKSYIHQGAEASYNFYLMEKEDNKIEQSELFFYHNHRLVITVHKGTVIRAGEKVWFRPGYGEHVRIKVPSFFSSAVTEP